jgi:hypothetical protein
MNIRNFFTHTIFQRISAIGFIVILAFGILSPSISPVSEALQFTQSVPVHAQGDVTTTGLDFLEIIPFRCLFSRQGDGCTEDNSLLDALANFLFGLAVPLAILVIMWGGYRYFFGGITGKADGMKTIQAAIIGLVLVLSAQLITDTLNQSITNDGFDTGAITALAESTTALMVNLAITGAILVIVWGGYKYFFGALIEKADGLKTVRAGVIGLVFILLANFIANTLNDIFGGITTSDQISEIPGRFDEFLRPILEQITTVLQGLAGIVSVLVIIWGGYQYFFSTLPNGKKNGLETISKGVIGLVVTIIATPIVTLVRNTLGSPENTDLQLDPQSIIAIFQTIVTNFLIPVSAAATVFFLILGAYQWLSAGGDANKVKAGKDSLRNAVIGFIVVLLATTFTQLIIFLFRNTDLEPGPATPPAAQQQNNNNDGGNTGGGQPTPDGNPF